MEKFKNVPVLYKGIVISLIITVLFTSGFITGAMTAALREEPLNVNVFLPVEQVEATTTTVPPTTAPPTTAVPTTAAPETTTEATTEPTTTAPAEETEEESCCIMDCLTKIFDFIMGAVETIMSMIPMG